MWYNILWICFITPTVISNTTGRSKYANSCYLSFLLNIISGDYVKQILSYKTTTSLKLILLSYTIEIPFQKLQHV